MKEGLGRPVLDASCTGPTGGWCSRCRRWQQERVARETLAELQRGAAGAAPRDELPDVGAESHRARLRRTALDADGDVRLLVYDPNDPARARAHHLRPDRARASRRARLLRHRAGARSGRSACTTGRCSRPMRRARQASARRRRRRPTRWYSHGLNRVAYYRLATAAGAALPRPARLRLARGLGRLLARALPRGAPRGAARISAACCPGAPPARPRRARCARPSPTSPRCFADLLTLNRRARRRPPR